MQTLNSLFISNKMLHCNILKIALITENFIKNQNYLNYIIIFRKPETV